MTEEEKKAAEDREARRDAQIDKVLSHLNDVSKRLDAIEGKRTDADDPERATWMAEDAAACERDDAEEAAEREKLTREFGMAEPVAADAARKARKDRMKARKDAAGRRMDSAALTTAQAADLRAQEVANLDVQARADAVCRAWGEAAGPPMQGESTLAYRVRMLRHHQHYCTEPSFKTLDLGALAASQPAALDGIERRIYADSAAASANPTGPDDRMIKRTTIDPDSGHRVTTFHGRRTFIWHLKRPSMRATAFNLPSNRAA